ncbi:MAG: hypothetical protein SVS85_02110 [Candidatus Nanohaloarchaea archaeon]|nr:hypothetical protein [Candidatus Nanohaloarchaea archaeon]
MSTKGSSSNPGPDLSAGYEEEIIEEILSQVSGLGEGADMATLLEEAPAAVDQHFQNKYGRFGIETPEDLREEYEQRVSHGYAALKFPDTVASDYRLWSSAHERSGVAAR